MTSQSLSAHLLDFAARVERSRPCDIVFAAQQDGAERLRAAGIESATCLALACDPAVHRKHDVPKQYDVSFVGRFCPGTRNELLDLLRHKIPNHLVRQGYFDKTARIYSGQSFGSTAGPQVVFGYDAGGRMTTMTRTIGASSYFTTTITYDLVNRVTAINNFIGGGRMVITYGNYGYDYDAASRVTGAGGPGFNLGYTYNADNELTNAAGTLNGNSVNVTYVYDSAGNRNSTGYTNGTGDEQSASPGYTYSYDNDGNLISETNTSTSIITTYTYDAGYAYCSPCRMCYRSADSATRLKQRTDLMILLGRATCSSQTLFAGSRFAVRCLAA